MALTMTRLLLVAALSAILSVSSGQDDGNTDPSCPIDEYRDAILKLQEDYGRMLGTVRDLARQTMLQQLFVEERIRSDGDSGVKVIRSSIAGPENYYSSTHMGNSFDAIHDHSNYARTIGMGETVAVLNGVEFRTRHNDYKLKMPSQTSTEYHATEDIPFPEVPPAVKRLNTVQEQIDEMREWFKAFKTQDTSVRDFRPYFKPILCYLEGAWTLDEELEEPFESDRHHIDASSWFQLQELIRYSSYTGTKSRLENYAYLPTTIMAVNVTDGRTIYAQWNYRIVCKPVPDDVDIPLQYLKQTDDLAHRVPRDRKKEDVHMTRAARYRFYEHEKPKFTRNGLLDQIFYSIPGKDNIPDNITQSSFGETMYEMGPEQKLLNTGYYHRWFKFAKPGAMGLTTVARGFNDENLWVAQTTQKRVAPIGIEFCKKEKVNGKKRKVCKTYYTRFSYAIPLEIIYLTPLLTWNPYNFYQQPDGGAVKGGRNGREDNPLNGTDYARYYNTPAEFFQGRTDKSDPADTVRNKVYVLDQNNVPRVTVASGTKIILQSIENVGKVRLRYPIAPVHGEGSSVWKELNALKEIVGRMSGNVEEPDGEPQMIEFEMSPTNIPMEHTHEFIVSSDDYQKMKEEGLQVQVSTSQAQGHTHDLTILYSKRRQRFEYKRCGMSSNCPDRHPKELLEIKDFSDIV